MTFLLTIDRPTYRVLSERVDSVTLPGVFGQMTILPHHTHIVTKLVSGEVVYKKKDEEGEEEVQRIEITLGVAEMSREGKLTIFVR
jgi:F0F1-type ATP synthase epsilon subunit